MKQAIIEDETQQLIGFSSVIVIVKDIVHIMFLRNALTSEWHIAFSLSSSRLADFCLRERQPLNQHSHN